MADRAGALQALHARLLSDPTLQFSFTAVPLPQQWKTPAWLKAIEVFIGHLVSGAFPFLRILFWVGIAAVVLGVIFLIAREIFAIRFGKSTKAVTRSAPADWRPETWKARALLEDADRLASEGRYDEAARLILHRGIDDIEQRRPKLVRPALTARDIAALEDVPTFARQAFTRIALAVEASWFGGRLLDADGFAQCRAAYETFAFPEAWR